ncbi:MAG: hypothetical protein IPM12_08700 [Flavobacteriales bacterium]|nr:hypothetical protein [Flavobacteriales bacterium]
MAAEDRSGPIAFPAYRRLQGSDHYYRIDGPASFAEVQRIGRRLVRHRVTDAKYPEQVRIAQMLDCDDGRYAVLDEEAWAAIWAASATFTTNQPLAGNPGDIESVE